MLGARSDRSSTRSEDRLAVWPFSHRFDPILCIDVSPELRGPAFDLRDRTAGDGPQPSGRERSGIRATTIPTWSGASISRIAPSPPAEARRS